MDNTNNLNPHHQSSDDENEESDVNRNDVKSVVINKDYIKMGTQSEKERLANEGNLSSSQLFEKYYAEIRENDDYMCGMSCLRGRLLQKLANKKVYVFLYGITGCIFAATYAYFNGTITTIEKRYKIPTRVTGIISVGNDISQLLLSAILSYYTGRSHKPRWMAFGLVCISIFCFLNMLPHFLYGAGDDALSLTQEYGGNMALFDDSQTMIMNQFRNKSLCNRNTDGGMTCEKSEGSVAPQVILFVAQFIAGIGGSLYFTLGVAYMDDNIKKSKTPALVSLSYFLRMLGPAIGYTLASFCLKMYISPSLTPRIENTDPRWLGAWWLGWAILGSALLVAATLMAMFPRELPRAAARKRAHKERLQRGLSVEQPTEELPTSFKDMMATFKRLSKNAILMCNNISAIFYFFGFLPYWIFTPKYIETQYKQSASIASLVTGSVALAFSALGILLSGVVISKFKPAARSMAAWNVLCGMVAVMGIITYSFLGCPANENTVIVPKATDANAMCVNSCHCDYIKYSPVCASNGKTYISACHAGCTDLQVDNDGKKTFLDCGCLNPNTTAYLESQWTDEKYDFVATAGACEVNCFNEFMLFLGVMCFLKFISATGRATNFLVSVRCVDEKDKSVSMGFGLMLMSLFAFIPSPIFFGSLLDQMCLVWGKTCKGTGNCWLYDVAALRFYLNFIAASFVFIGTCFDVGVWYFVKDLKIFDEEGKDEKAVDLKLQDLDEPIRRGSLIEQFAR